MERHGLAAATALVAVVAALATLAVSATPVNGGPTRSIVPEVIDMGVTGRRSSGPGPAGEAGEAVDGESLAAAHVHLTQAITSAPTPHHYQHVQGGFIRSEPANSRPVDEDVLQSGLTRQKRADHHQQQALLDQEAEASSHAEEADDDAETAASEGGAGADDGDMFLEPDAAAGEAHGDGGGAVPSPTGEPAATTDATGQPQNIFPAFQPLFPLGHSRPSIFQEPSFPQRQSLLRSQQFNPFQVPIAESREPRLDLSHHAAHAAHAFRERAYPQASPIAAPAELHSNSLLGSGNFGVIHGGTFYGEEKESQDYEAPLHSFYGGNGHGRPAFYRGNPEPQRYRTSEDFFANFRDFADISTPTKSSFSEYYVVYVNRNASRADPGTVVGPEGTPPPTAPSGLARLTARPNNIFERLAQIDLEHAANREKEEEVPEKKLSLGKRKLALLDKKKTGKKTPGDSREAPSLREGLHEPLLALS